MGERVNPDFLLIPGKNAGFITRDTTEDALTQRMPGQIERVLYDEGEGEYRCATKLFPGEAKEITIAWQSNTELFDADKDGVLLQVCKERPSFSRPEYVVLENKSSPWATREGVTIGMSLEDLEDANGAPITFSVCDCDIGGNVMNLNGGHLPKDLFIQLDAPGDWHSSLERYVTEADDGVMSDRVPISMKSKIAVTKVVMYFQ